MALKVSLPPFPSYHHKKAPSCLLAVCAVAGPRPITFPYTVKGKTGKLNTPAKAYVVLGTQLLNPTTLKNEAFELKGRNFDILGVSLNNEKSRGKWVKARQDDQLAWVQVSDLRGWQNQTAQFYGVQAVLQSFLVDPNGKLVATNLRGDDLKMVLAQCIK